MVSYGAKIRAMRGMLGINQTKLVEMTNINRYDLSMLEKDKYIPTPETKARIKAALGIDLEAPEVEQAFKVLIKARLNQSELTPIAA